MAKVRGGGPSALVRAGDVTFLGQNSSCSLSSGATSKGCEDTGDGIVKISEYHGVCHRALRLTDDLARLLTRCPDNHFWMPSTCQVLSWSVGKSHGLYSRKKVADE